MHIKSIEKTKAFLWLKSVVSETSKEWYSSYLIDGFDHLYWKAAICSMLILHRAGKVASRKGWATDVTHTIQGCSVNLCWTQKGTPATHGTLILVDFIVWYKWVALIIVTHSPWAGPPVWQNLLIQVKCILIDNHYTLPRTSFSSLETWIRSVNKTENKCMC